MKSRIRTIKSDNTMVVDYSGVKKPFEFRYNLLSNILNTNNEAIMFINTNTKTEAMGNNIEDFFEENGLENAVIKIKARERTIFGMSLKAFRNKKPQLDEKFIMAKIKSEVFTKEFFDKYIATYDVALAFDSKISVEELNKDYRENAQELYFDKEYFENFLYDSILFKSLRTTFNIKDIVEECEK